MFAFRGEHDLNPESVPFAAHCEQPCSAAIRQLRPCYLFVVHNSTP
jgi:hypothetical protein